MGGSANLTPRGGGGAQGTAGTESMSRGELASNSGAIVVHDDAGCVRRKFGGKVPKRNGPGIELLADPTRRRIVALLAIHSMRPKSIAREIGLSRPATSRQLHLLLDAGLIRSTWSPIDGRGRLFGLEPRAHGSITAWLAGTGFGGRVGLWMDEEGRVRDG